MFKAILIEKNGDCYQATLTQLNKTQLLPADVTVKVSYCSLNDQAGLALSSKSPVVRPLPMVSGIDLPASVIDSQSDVTNSMIMRRGW